MSKITEWLDIGGFEFEVSWTTFDGFIEDIEWTPTAPIDPVDNPGEMQVRAAIAAYLKRQAEDGQADHADEWSGGFADNH